MYNNPQLRYSQYPLTNRYHNVNMQHMRYGQSQSVAKSFCEFLLSGVTNDILKTITMKDLKQEICKNL